MWTQHSRVKTDRNAALSKDPTAHELDAPPWLRVESTLMATARAVRDVFDARFAPLGLNLTQASVIAYLQDFGPVSQTQIADHLCLGRAAIGVIIDRLQDRDLTERLADVVDRRVWRVSLSTAGEAMALQIRGIDEVLRAELRHDITREERQALASVLTRLQLNLERAASPTTLAASTAPTTTSTAPTTERP